MTETVDDLRQQVDAQRKQLRVFWQRSLDKLTELVEEIPGTQPSPELGLRYGLLLQSLESGLVEDHFGELLPAAERLRQQAMELLKKKLNECTLATVDPASVPDECDAPAHVLEVGLAGLEMIELNEVTFFGDTELLQKAAEMKAETISKVKRLIVRAKAADRTVADAKERRDALMVKHVLQDAAMTAAQRAARATSIHEKAGELFKLVRHLTQITKLDEANHCGAIDSDALLDIVREAHALIADITKETA